MRDLSEIHQAQSLFLAGPAGTGKSTAAAQHIRELAEKGLSLTRTLVLIPATYYAKAYQQVLANLPINDLNDPASIILTVGNFARRTLIQYWWKIAPQVGFKAGTKPTFLSSELAQYFLKRFAEPYIAQGVFDSVYLSHPRLIAQIFDNYQKILLGGFSLEEGKHRLISAWSNRHSSRLKAYETAVLIAQDYQAFCLEMGYYDYATQLWLLHHYLLQDEHVVQHLKDSYDYVVVDNIEETSSLAHDIFASFLDSSVRTLLIYDQDGGYRSFLGIDPANALKLSERCEKKVVWEQPIDLAFPMHTTINYIAHLFVPDRLSLPQRQPDLRLHLQSSMFYPEMIEQCIQRTRELVTQRQVIPQQISLLIPILNDSLSFALQNSLKSWGINSVVLQPSRPLYAQIVVQAIITLLYASQRQWGRKPTTEAVAQALSTVIEDLDPIRAFLLSRITYQAGGMTGFAHIQSHIQERITRKAGLSYERLSNWLTENAHLFTSVPFHVALEQFIQDILAQPGYRPHQNADFMSALEALVFSAKRFYETVYQLPPNDWLAAGQEYLRFLAEDRSPYTPQFVTETPQAVSILPVHTFLTRHHTIDYQLWLDVGSLDWWERLEQPITHADVLRRSFPANTPWTDELEVQAQSDQLRKVILGLLRRCRHQVYAYYCLRSDTGMEPRGPLLAILNAAAKKSVVGSE